MGLIVPEEVKFVISVFVQHYLIKSEKNMYLSKWDIYSSYKVFIQDFIGPTLC